MIMTLAITFRDIYIRLYCIQKHKNQLLIFVLAVTLVPMCFSYDLNSVLHLKFNSYFWHCLTCLCWCMVKPTKSRPLHVRGISLFLLTNEVFVPFSMTHHHHHPYTSGATSKCCEWRNTSVEPFVCLSARLFCCIAGALCFRYNSVCNFGASMDFDKNKTKQQSFYCTYRVALTFCTNLVTHEANKSWHNTACGEFVTSQLWQFSVRLS